MHFATVRRDSGMVSVDVWVNDKFAQPIDISGDVRNDFINLVALMALYPYLRQLFADITQRVFGEPVTLGVLRQGQFEITHGPNPADDR